MADERVARPSARELPLNEAGPRRDVVQAEALEWLASRTAEPGTSVITSLPDLSECPGLALEAWRTWFVEAARAVLRYLPEDGLGLFFQSDIRHRGVWIDKAYLVQRAAEEERASLVFHKIVCRMPPGTVSHGRPSYSHLLGFSRTPRSPGARPGPDVLDDAGFMPWSRAMGVAACELACRFLRDETSTLRVVDPFCGQGTVLAVANAFGFDAVGVDLSRKRCKIARNLVLPVSPSASDRPRS